MAGLPFFAMADGLSQDVLDRINAAIMEIEAVADSRTEADKKMSSGLLEMTGREHLPHQEPGMRRSAATMAEKVDCEIACEDIDRVSDLIAALGGETVFASKTYKSIHARLPVSAMQTLSEDESVSRIADLREHMLNKANTSQGYTAHRVDKARTDYGVTGKGIKVGIISDSVKYLGKIQSDGDLPDVTVLSGVGGVSDSFVKNGGTGEGCGMLEIVYDLAPQAQLYFASGWGNTLAAFADAVDKLAQKGCNVIIDDVTCYKEFAFQDSPIMESINKFTDSGGIYFSSAANSGNLDTGNSGTWEGDFHGSGVSGSNGEYHSFSGKQGEYLLQIKSFGNNDGAAARIELQWSDPWGKSGNDYNLYLIAPNDANPVKASSTSTQNGQGEPYERIDVPVSLYKASGNTLVPSKDLYLAVVKKSGAAARFLRLDMNRGRLHGGTAGSTYGHNAADRAITVAAAPPPANSSGQEEPRAFKAGDPIETYSSDGPRKMFYNSGGTPYSSGNFLSSGGKTLNKPDVTAADSTKSQWIYYATSGQSTSFGGTSAAAPHAGAIAALMLEANPELNRDAILDIFKKSTFGTPAWNRTKGYGIIDAYTAVKLAKDGNTSSVAVSPASKSFPSYADSGSFSVAAKGAWTASRSDAWITLETASGNGNGTVRYSVSANSNTKEREGTITVKCGSATATHEITQAAAAALLGISPAARDFSNEAGNGSFDVTANYPWTVSASAGWIVPDTTSGSGNGRVSYGVLENSGDQRTGTITVKSENGLTEKHTVRQAAPPQLEISPASREFGAASGTGTFSVTSDSMWTVTPSDSWIKADKSSGSGNGTVNYSVDSNGGARREGYIHVNSGSVSRTFTVKQSCGEVVAFSAESISIPAEGGSGTLTATILWSGSGDMEVSTDYSGVWISWTSTQQKITDGYRYVFSYSAQPNTTADMHETAITVVLNGKTHACPITQDPATGMFRVTYRPGAYGTGEEISLSKASGTLILKGAIYKRDGYTQTGWSTTDGGPMAYGLLSVYAEGRSIVLYPYWEKKATMYAIQFKPGQYGSGFAQTREKTKGVPLTLPGALFTRDGYEQTGWSTSDAGTSKAYDLGGQYTADAAATFYPYWTKPTGSEPQYDFGFYQPDGWNQPMCLSAGNLDDGVYAPQVVYESDGGLVLNYCIANWSKETVTLEDRYMTLWDMNDNLVASKLEREPVTIGPNHYMQFRNRNLSPWLSSLEPGDYYLEVEVDPYGKLNEADKSDNWWGAWFEIPVRGLTLNEALECDSLQFMPDKTNAAISPHSDQIAVGGSSVQFGPQLPNTEGTPLWAAVAGPGTLSFQWDSYASSTNSACMAFFVDGNLTRILWSNSGGWVRETVEIEDGNHWVAWSFWTYDGNPTWLTAGWLDDVSWTPTRQTYNVTYRPGSGGSGQQWTDSKQQGIALTLRGATYTRPGYTQTGWATSDGGAKAYELRDSYAADAALSLYPYWTANTYGISYELDGGAAGTAHQESAAYDTAFRVSAPTREGFVFQGWRITSGLDISTARYGGTQSSQATGIDNASQQCFNGAAGDVWFINLASVQGAQVVLAATWEEVLDDARDIGFYAPEDKGWTFPLCLSPAEVEWLEYSPETEFEQGAPIYLGFCVVNWNRSGTATLQSTRLTFTDEKGKVVREGEPIQRYTMGVYAYQHFFNIQLNDYLDGVAPGKYKLTAEVDPNRVLNDPNRSNNTTSIWFTITAPADPIPELPAGASAAAVAAALEGSADGRLARNITDAATYSAYREWAQSVKGVDGKRMAGKQTVKDSSTAWRSFALGLDTLIVREVKSDNVDISAFNAKNGGKQFDFEVEIDGVEIGSSTAIPLDVLKNNLKKVLEAEGVSTLVGESVFTALDAGIVSVEPANGKARFTVTLPSDSTKVFFLRVGMK